MSTNQGPEAVRLLTLPETAHQLSVCKRTLERLIAAGEFPRPLKIGRSTRVPVSDVSAYLAKLIDQRGTGS